METLQGPLGVPVFPYINGRIYDVNTTMYKHDHATLYATKAPATEAFGNPDLVNYVEVLWVLSV